MAHSVENFLHILLSKLATQSRSRSTWARGTVTTVCMRRDDVARCAQADGGAVSGSHQQRNSSCIADTPARRRYSCAAHPTTRLCSQLGLPYSLLTASTSPGIYTSIACRSPHRGLYHCVPPPSYKYYCEDGDTLERRGGSARRGVAKLPNVGSTGAQGQVRDGREYPLSILPRHQLLGAFTVVGTLAARTARYPPNRQDEHGLQLAARSVYCSAMHQASNSYSVSFVVCADERDLHVGSACSRPKHGKPRSQGRAASRIEAVQAPERLAGVASTAAMAAAEVSKAIRMKGKAVDMWHSCSMISAHAAHSPGPAGRHMHELKLVCNC